MAWDPQLEALARRAHATFTDAELDAVFSRAAARAP